MISLIAVSVLFLFFAGHAGKIEVCVVGSEAGVQTQLANASVKCYDQDTIGSDDHMGSGTTNSQGCVTINYTTKNPSFWKACHGWDWCADKPDIYCKVTKDAYYPVYSKTKTSQSQSKTLNLNMAMYIDRVKRGDTGNANGCGPSSMGKFGTDVADALSGFENQCKNHDLCYESCTETKKTCDDEFRDMMVSQCNYKFDHKFVETCWGNANVLDGMVRAFGDDAYAGAREKGNCDRRRLEASLSDPEAVADRLLAAVM